jgi:hypothetical protein
LDDLKVILYVVGAIAWLLYKNYQKVREQSRQRDVSKPFEDEVLEPPKPIPSVPSPTVVKTVRTPSRPIKPKPPVNQRTSAQSYREQSVSHVTPVEGGVIKPSESVRFEDPVTPEISWNNPIAEEIRSADFRKAFILSEVLQRPYN